MDYNSTQTVTKGGKKIVRKVTIKHNKGFKSVTKYHKGRKVHSVKKPIHVDHLHLIKKGKFIPGLFSDCKFCKSKKCKHCKTKKLRGGGPLDDYYKEQNEKDRINAENSYNKLNAMNNMGLSDLNLNNNMNVNYGLGNGPML
jgi:hypothetical protein